MPLLAALLMLLALAVAGCGDDVAGSATSTVPAPVPVHQDEADAAYAYDPAVDVIPDSQAQIDRLMTGLGDRPDYKVKLDTVKDLPRGQLTYAVIARMWKQWNATGEYRFLADVNPTQRAVFNLVLADSEIQRGGFAEYWDRAPDTLVGDLPDAARRVGAASYAELFHDAFGIWGEPVPVNADARRAGTQRLDADALAKVDERYAALQYRHETALGTVLGKYIRQTLDAFTYR
ncbi:MAG: hypothetical protein JHC95_15390 [Solirubrobacteraceae bacterium]|nr:hypothetical protein [Solirubrobacteraceae bacterium]